MPKLGKKSVAREPQQSNEAVKTKTTGTGVYIVFTEDDLRGMPISNLDKILIIYGVDAAAELKKSGKTRATESFKIDLILAVQLDAINTKGVTPKGLLQISGVKETNMGFTTTIISVTVNMGDYNSLKMESGLTLPVGYDKNLEEVAMEQLGKQLEINKNFLKLRVEKAKEDFEPIYHNNR